MPKMILRSIHSTLRGLLPLDSVFKPRTQVVRQMESRMEPSFSSGEIADTDPSGREFLRGGQLELNRLLVAARSSPDLAPIEWDGDGSSDDPELFMDGAEPTARSMPDQDPRTFDARQRRIRDRYIGARFPGVARDGADLRAVDRIIKSARLHFEAGEFAAALELLDLAVEESPHESSLWLARLEILFLSRDREGFIAGAQAFRDSRPGHDAWTEIQRLGRQIAPGEALFGATIAARDHEHYGPWPHLPNWIQAPWDLTAEVVAADFHRAMLRLVANLSLPATA
jgi:hypothetical protein